MQPGCGSAACGLTKQPDREVAYAASQANLASAQLAANSTLQGTWLSGSAAAGSGGNDFPSSSGGAALGFPFALGGTTGLGLDVGSLSGGRGGLESLSLGGFSYAAG